MTYEVRVKLTEGLRILHSKTASCIEQHAMTRFTLLLLALFAIIIPALAASKYLMHFFQLS